MTEPPHLRRFRNAGLGVTLDSVCRENYVSKHDLLSGTPESKAAIRELYEVLSGQGLREDRIQELIGAPRPGGNGSKRCANCKDLFLPRQRTQICCSPECGAARKEANRLGWYEETGKHLAKARKAERKAKREKLAKKTAALKEHNRKALERANGLAESA